MRKLYKFLYFKILGWKLIGGFPNVDKCVVAVVPHTHWLDFFLGLLVRKVINEEINYIGKRSLFKPPFGWFFRWTGGAPIDRSKSSNTVESIVNIFKERKVFRFALAPEGTRKKVSELKTGFYHIAVMAQVPIVAVAFDFGKKQVKISKAIYPTGEMQEDFKVFHNFFEGVVGKIPEYSF
ncbi:1-acyl-sn-glycerol-3-phosphate acyltransferase [Flagellimonas sp. HMM57]|uniref:1-acyl-sn-glycerol-3-phosphate acyltransferase n=1 Tax=unclassified Flagellimonas TaxID=2644544 RepID=UPI0013CFEF7D|nr:MULTISPECIES: 1-acyl-sn-glycerol-3-phosphate acyltransferase [unclassified Flagellimonas]UII76306.1 1-acyl-sn-glycerol-3-phosphate acyltransferase [Flagellimonas sp. HMM57]